MYSIIFSLFLGCAPDTGKEPTSLTVDQEQLETITPIPEDPYDTITVDDIGIQSPTAFDECSQKIGNTPCDIILKDQDDNFFRLYDHVGEVILLDFSVGWCGPCIRAAATVEQIQQQYGADGFIYVTIMIEDNQQNPTTLSYAQHWADTYGIESAPVLQGSRDLIDYNSVEGYNLTSWPTFYIIDRDMNLDAGIRGFSEEWIHLHIQDLI